MSRYRFEHEGELWWAGYDVPDATYFVDRDTDLDLDDYLPPRITTFPELVEATPVPIPSAILDRLRAEEPRDPLSAEAAAIARMDQVGAALSASFPRESFQLSASPPVGPSAPQASSSSFRDQRRPSPGIDR